MKTLNKTEQELLVRYHFRVLNPVKKLEAEKLIAESLEAKTIVDKMERWSSKGESDEGDFEDMKKYWRFASVILREIFNGVHETASSSGIH